MPRFRAARQPVSVSAQPLSEEVSRIVAEVCHAAHFFAHDLRLRWEEKTEEIVWELFRGRLLDPAHTRQRRRFHAWSVFQLTTGERSPEPIVSVKLDREADALHVVRALPCHAWEAYDGGDNVILSRETIKWLRELIGTIALADVSSTDDLRHELAGLLFQAVIGTSRLPLTSVEAPLPLFTLGQFAYVFRAGADVAANFDEPGMASWQELIDRGLNADLAEREQVKLLECLLRTVPASDLARATERFVQRWQVLGRSPAHIPPLWRAMFNEVSLSPYTDFVDKSLAFLGILVEQSWLAVSEQIDGLSYMLRQLGRHLTAYDLVMFHHRGANYPDALLLDAALKAYLALAEQHPQLFFSAAVPAPTRPRIRRRALRQACLFRLRYAGHAVPDAPTSAGENARVLPPPHVRVPDEQILQPAKRNRRLYADDPLDRLLTANTRKLLQQALDDLRHADELRELGTAVFIDRPLGMGKPAGAPDQTPLLAHEAFSRRIAQSRLRDLDRLAHGLGLLFDLRRSEEQLRDLEVAGLPLSAVWTPDRPTVSLADARRVADDFVLRRTLPSSVGELLRLFAFAEVDRRLSLNLPASARLWLVPVGADRLAVFDETYRKRVEMTAGTDRGFRVRGGVELPVSGLRLVRVWRELSDGALKEETSSEVVLFFPETPCHSVANFMQ